MAISEQSRHHLYQQLETSIGGAAAGTLMEHLPPIGWADVATKRDLDALSDRLKAEFQTGINGAITSQTRTLLFAIVGSNLTMAALALAAAA